MSDQISFTADQTVAHRKWCIEKASEIPDARMADIIIGADILEQHLLGGVKASYHAFMQHHAEQSALRKAEEEETMSRSDEETTITFLTNLGYSEDAIRTMVKRMREAATGEATEHNVTTTREARPATEPKETDTPYIGDRDHE